MLVGALLVAVVSHRLGAKGKFISILEGQRLIGHTAESLIQSSLDHYVATVSSDYVVDLLPSEFDTVKLCPNQLMSNSFHAAVDYAALKRADGILFMLADMPKISSETIRQVVTTSITQKASACTNNRCRMPPVYMSLDYLQMHCDFHQADRGARDLISKIDADNLDSIDDERAIDIDTFSDLPRTRMSFFERLYGKVFPS